MAEVALLVNGVPAWYANVKAALDEHGHTWLQQNRTLEPEARHRLQTVIDAGGAVAVYGYEQSPTSRVVWRFSVDRIVSGAQRVPPPDETAPPYGPYDKCDGPEDFTYLTWLRVVSCKRVGPYELKRFECAFEHEPMFGPRGWVHQLVTGPSEVSEPDEPPSTEEAVGTALGLERDLGVFLAAHPERLEQELTLFRGGREVNLPGARGRADILCTDAAGNVVVIELKAGTVKPDAVGQIAAYMGAVSNELAKGQVVRGIIVGNEFDDRVRLAAGVVPNLRLVKYEMKFEFREAKR